MRDRDTRKQIKRKRQELQFLPAALEVLETPPRPAARLIALLICVFFVSTVTWAILGRINTTATASGQIVPTERVKLIQPLESGVIRAIHVKDGQRVKKGEVLIELDPTEAQANTQALRYDLMKARVEAAAAEAAMTDDPVSAFNRPDDVERLLTNLIVSQMYGEFNKHRAMLAVIDAEIEDDKAAMRAMETNIRKAIDTLPLLTERLDNQETLYAKRLTRKSELFALRQSHIEMRAEIDNAEPARAQARSKITAKLRRRDEVIATYRAGQLQKRAEALRKISGLKQQLLKEERRSRDRKLRAPVDGTVFGLAVSTVGGVVATKDVLLRLVPAGSPLEIEAVVLNKDIGFVSVGQAVEIKLDPFPFTRYGLVNGTVRELARDAIPDDKLGLVYKALIDLKETKILVGDKWLPLAPGMSVQAEIKTGERRIIEFFLSPFLRYRDEALRER